MKLAILALFCWGTALANMNLRWTNDPSVLGQIVEEQKEFRFGRETKYIYNGQVMTGIPGTSKQHSGSRLQAKVKFVCKNQETCIMKIEQIRVGKLNRHVKTPRHVLPAQAFDPVPLDAAQREKLHLPLKFSNNKGLINNIVFDGREKAWSANIKRGILHLIQVNLQNKKHSTTMDIVDIVEDEYLNAYKPTERDASFYRTLEETIEGQCETMYTVTKPQVFKSANQDIFNVTKTVNFEKCVKRPQIKYNFDFSDPCPTCESKYVEDQKFLKSSSISSYQVIKTGKLQIVNNAHTESEYVFTPLNEEANSIVTYVSQNLKLIKTGVAVHRVQVPMEPKKSDSDMIYSLDQDIAKETFQMEGNSKELEEALLHKGQQNKIQIAINLLRKLTNNIREQVQEPATKHFKQLVNLMRLMSKTELDQLHNVAHNKAALTVTPYESFSHQEQKRAKDLLHDAMGSAATKPTVQHLVEKIKQREVSIIKAISAIKNLMTMRTPSKEIIEELIKLGESQVAERHYMLKQATWLTIGTLMKSLCNNEQDQWAREFKEQVHQKLCPKTLKQQYVKVLLKKLHSTHKWDEQLIFVKTLGNAGIDLSVFEIEKIIQNKNFHHRTLIRVEAVLALRKLKSIMPKKIQKVLMPVVSNKMQPQTLRIAAAYMILQTLPNRPVLDQLAKLVQDEKSIQVSSFVHSYMESMANSTNPCERKLATDLRLSLRQTHKIYSRVLGNSKFVRVPMHSQHQKIGLDLDLTSTFAEGRKVPHQLAASLHSNFLGFWNKYMVSFKLATEGLDKTLRHAYRQFDYTDEYDQESFFRSEYEEMFSPAKMFGQQVRDQTSKEPKAVLSLKIKNQDIGFLPIKRHAIESLLHGHLSGNMHHIAEKLRHGVHINYNKATLMDEVFYKIPTTIGMPVFVNIRVPVVANVHGALKMTPLGGSVNNVKAFQLKAVLKPSFVASVAVDVEIWSPIVTSGVNVVSKIKAFKPVDVKLLVDLKSQTKIVKLLIKPPTHKKDLVTLESRPSTFTLVQPKQMITYENKQKRLILSEEGTRIRTIHQCNTCTYLGVRYCIKGRYHKTPEHSMTNAPFIPLSGPNKVVISTQPIISTPHTIVINIFGKFLKPIPTWSIKSSLSSAQRNFLNFVSSPEDYSTLNNEYSSILGTQTLFNDEPTVGMGNLLTESARYNTAPSRDPYLKHKQLKRPLLNSLRIKIEAPQRHTSFDLVHIFNLDGDYHKVQAKLHRSPVPEHPRPFKVCLNAETVLPTLKLIQDLPNGEVLGKMSLRWGHSCSSSNFVHVVKRLEKHFSPRTYELENPEWRLHKDSNMRHDELLKKSPIKYIFDIKYQNVPLKAKHYGNELLRYVKKRYYDQTNVAEVAVHNRPQHIKVIVAIDPVTLKKCDVLIKTPKSDVLIRDLHMPSYISPVTHKHDYLKNEKKSLTRETLYSPRTAQCYATEYNVKTFHDKELPLPLSHSYKVLAKDCQNNRFTVLIRQLTDVPQLKEVKIHAEGQRVTLKPSLTRRDKTKVFVNGKDETLQHDIVKTVAGIPVLRIIRQSSHVKVEILTAGVSVYFDRKSVNVEIPPQERHKQCGICGTRSFSSLKNEIPTYLQESPIVNEIEREFYEIEQHQGFGFNTFAAENVIDRMQHENQLEEILDEQTLGNSIWSSPLSGLSSYSTPYSSPLYNIETAAFRDYSTFDDVLGHYFNYRPSRKYYELEQDDEQMLEEELYEKTTRGPFGWGSNYRTTFESEIDAPFYEELSNQRQGWSKPSERQWEIEQLVSKNNPNPSYEALKDLDKINSDFDRYYSPVSTLEREFESNWRDESFSSEIARDLSQESIFSPWSPINSIRLGQSDVEQQLVEEEYLLNPYLSKNYLVNKQSCKYLPFWQRKLQGCEDVFSTVFDDQDEQKQMERQILTQELINDQFSSGYPMNDARDFINSPSSSSSLLAEVALRNDDTEEYENWQELTNVYGNRGEEFFGGDNDMYDNYYQGPSEQTLKNKMIRQQILEQEIDDNDDDVTTMSPFSRRFSTNDVIDTEELISEGIYGQKNVWQNEIENQIQGAYSHQQGERKQKVIETENSICFSTVPVECRERTYPKNGVKQQVQYHCMSRQNPRAQKYQNEILAGRPVVPSLLGAAPTMSRVEIVAAQCTPVY